MTIKRSFAFLCNFLYTLRNGLGIVVDGVTNDEMVIDGLRTAIIIVTISIIQSKET